MQLTAEQKELVARFLRTQDELFVALPSEKRVQALSQVKQRIRTELAALKSDSISDEQMHSLLRRMKISVRAVPGAKKSNSKATVDDKTPTDATLSVTAPVWTPSTEPVLPPPPPPGAKSDSNEDIKEVVDDDFGERHWLGVCVSLSDRLGQPLFLVRVAFVLFGCLTGPIAVTAYLGLFALGRQRHPREYPEPDLTRMWLALIRLVCLSGSMFGASWLLDFGVGALYVGYFGQEPDLSEWGRVADYTAPSLLLVLFLLAPFSALSGMPLAYHWEKTVTNLVNAALAVYGVMISVGVASSMVGYTLSGLTLLAG